MPFEEFDKRTPSSTRNPFVTVLSTKGFTLNKAAHDLLGKPKAVTLLYDPDERLIGFKPSSPDYPRSYLTRSQPKGTAISVSGRSFMKHYGIDASTTRRYAAEMRDGVLVLDLDSESTGVVGPRKRKRRQELQGA